MGLKPPKGKTCVSDFESLEDWLKNHIKPIIKIQKMIPKKKHLDIPEVPAAKKRKVVKDPCGKELKSSSGQGVSLCTNPCVEGKKSATNVIIGYLVQIQGNVKRI